jgi:hypothetical protein
MIGRVVSHYEIVEKIGAGGMGEVFKARDRRLSRFVALKVLPSDQVEDPDRRSRFLQEAQAASALNHPNIIVVHDVVADEAGEYLVMEFVTGKSLADLIPKGGLPVGQVLRYGIQMADALAAAHAAGIIHRDFKPGNVMVNDSGLVKVLDFGLAKVTRPVFEGGSDMTRQMDAAPKTAVGSIVGTASYMSPEQVESRPLDARSDVFAFGLVLYEMATGCRAFQGDSSISTLTSVLRDQPRRVTELSAEVPPQLERIINRCLEKDPEQRWQTMRDLHAALVGLREDLDSGSIVTSRRMAAQPAKPGRRAGLLALVAAAVIVAVGAGAWLSLRPRRPAGTAQQSPPPAGAAPEPVSAAPPQASPSAASVPNTRAAGPPAPKRVLKPTVTGAEPAATPASPAAAPVASAPPPAAPAAVREHAATAAVSIPDGSRVRLQIAEDIPAGAKKGDVVHMTVVEGLKIGAAVVVAKGATANGVIGEAGRRFLFGRKDKVPILLDKVTATDGTKIPLRATFLPPSAGKTGRSAVEVLPSGSKESGISLVKGTILDAYIDGSTEVRDVKK